MVTYQTAEGGAGSKTFRGVTLRHGRRDRAHLSTLEENTLDDKYNLTKLLLIKKLKKLFVKILLDIYKC